MIETIQSHEIAGLLDNAGDELEILSLDCFDTLIWRNVNLPKDVFFDLDIPNCSMEMRVLAEARARKALAFQKDRNEVNIQEIYANLFRGADDQEIAHCIAQEMAAEARHCFAFQPVSELIARAKARGMRVIIVSDTYLPEPLLRQLITDAAGQETIDRIDRIFCSCEYGENKAGGLFKDVLAELQVDPGQIIHLGDNMIADFEAPRKIGINGVHFAQFDDEATERLRLEAVAATIFEKDVRRSAPVLQPHRPQVSLRQDDDPIVQFGHDVLENIVLLTKSGKSFFDIRHEIGCYACKRLVQNQQEIVIGALGTLANELE